LFFSLTGWTGFLFGVFSGIGGWWTSRSGPFDELKEEIRCLKGSLDDLRYDIPPRHTKKLQRSAVLFLSAEHQSIGIGVFISPTRVITAFHVIAKHYKAMTKKNFKSVIVNGKYTTDQLTDKLALAQFRVVNRDSQKDLAVLDLVDGSSPPHSHCVLPLIGALSNLPSTARLVVTSFTSAIAKQVPDRIDEGFAVIPAQFIKATANFCAYQSSLFSGDSGGAFILAQTGDLLCIHLETVNEASEKLRKNATPEKTVSSINDLVSGLSSGFIGLRLDSQEVQDFINVVV
jgi:hypothetical protein